MADPGLTQAQFDEYWERGGAILGLDRALRALEKRCAEERVRCFNHNDKSGNFAAAPTLSGAVLGVNTSAEGRLYVRVTGAGPYTVSLYTATGGSGLVAQGSGAAGATVTLAEQNSSGLSGSVTLAGSVTAEADDVHRLLVFPDFKLVVNSAFNKDIERDAELEKELLATLARLVTALRSARGSVKRALERFMRVQLGPAVKSGNLKSSELLAREVSFDEGAVSVSLRGVLEDARLGMAANTPAQSVVKLAPTAGAVSYEAGNVGAGTTPTPSLHEHQEAGTWTFLCSDATLGGQTFEGSFAPSDPSRAHESYVSPVPLTIKKEWKDPGQDPGIGRPRVGVMGMTIDYARVADNDAGNSGDGVSETASDWSETGEGSDNSDAGKWYGSITDGGGGTFDISFYKDANKPSSALVAKATGVSGGASFTATTRNRSGLTIFGKLGATPVAGDVFTLDLKAFSKDGRADGAPDRFEFTVTASDPGVWQEELSELFGYGLNAVASGSETVEDELITRCGDLLIP